MLRHRWIILTAIAAVFVLLTGIEVVTIGNGPKKEVEAYKKALIAQGEKLEISELVPPPVPPEQNGVDIVIQALGMLTPEDSDPSNSIPAMRLIGPGKAMVCFEQPDVRKRYFTNSWENEAMVVEDDRPMLELLRQATAWPDIDFHLDYEKQTEDLRRPEPLYEAVRRLSAAAMCDLHRGDSESTNICTILALANGVRNERLLDFQAMRLFMIQDGARATWELLQAGKLNEAELAMVQTSWERIEFIHAAENAILMRRAMDEAEIIKMRTSDEYFNTKMSILEPSAVDWSDGLGSGLDQLAVKAKYIYTKSIYRASWTYSDELQMLQDDQLALETLRTAETNRYFYPACSNLINRLNVQENDEGDFFVRLDDFDFHHLFSMDGARDALAYQVMEIEAMRRIVVTAIALKRYQLKHGSYPAMLSDLVPAFISSVPPDPVDGRPLRYRPMADGNFLLYSVGENGKDDGGDASVKSAPGYNRLQWIEFDIPDWVWPQPATAAEVQYFYAHPPPIH